MEEEEAVKEEEIAQKLRELKVMKLRTDELDAERRHLQAELVELLEVYSDDEKFDAHGVRASVIRPVRTTWNEDALHDVIANLPGNLWMKITKRVLDKDKLEAQVKKGAIKLDQIEDCAEIKPTSPWIKVEFSE